MTRLKFLVLSVNIKESSFLINMSLIYILAKGTFEINRVGGK